MAHDPRSVPPSFRRVQPTPRTRQSRIVSSAVERTSSSSSSSNSSSAEATSANAVDTAPADAGAEDVQPRAAARVAIAGGSAHAKRYGRRSALAAGVETAGAHESVEYVIAAQTAREHAVHGGVYLVARRSEMNLESNLFSFGAAGAAAGAAGAGTVAAYAAAAGRGSLSGGGAILLLVTATDIVRNAQVLHHDFARFTFVVV